MGTKVIKTTFQLSCKIPYNTFGVAQ